MSRRKLFSEADLARAFKVAQAAGFEIGSFRIDADGAIVVESRPPPERDAYGPDAAQAALDALGRRIDARRAQRAASRRQ